MSEEVKLNVENGNHSVAECPLCQEKGLHIITTEASEETRQCLNCGYVTAPKFKCETPEDNEEYQRLTDDMKQWSKENDGHIWIPTIMTLPFGMLYPFNDVNNNMQWGYSDMIEIPEEEQKNYPAGDETEAEFYQFRYDTDNQIIFSSFLEGMTHINNKVKELKKQQSGGAATDPSMLNLNKSKEQLDG